MRIVRTILGCVFVMLIAIAPVRAQVSDAEVGAIRGVISEQLDAFRAGDAVRAFSYASPAIRNQFRDPGTFMDMVRTGYAPVYRPTTAEFLEIRYGRRGPEQDVYIVGADGKPVIARYFMQRQPDGTWRINGVVLRDAKDLVT